MITRFSVPNLHEVTIHLTNVINGKSKPDLILTNAKILSTYTDSILDNKEVWISKGRIACIKNTNDHKRIFSREDISVFDIENNILAPGLIDPHMHIESSMITGCAYAEAALLNGTTTIFCSTT